MGCHGDKEHDTKSTNKPSMTIQYLKGKMVTTSPDGATRTGPVEVLAKRTLNPDNGEIVEDTWHGKE